MTRDWAQAGKKQVDLLISGGTVVTQNARRDIISDGAVAIQGDRIVAVAPTEQVTSEYTGRRTVDASERYLFPGLINTHTHLLQTFMKGLGEGLPLYDWVRAVTGPTTAAMTAHDCYLAGMLGGLESLHCGTTTVVDYEYPLPSVEMYASLARAFGDLGLRAVLGLGLTETGEQHGLPGYCFRPVASCLEEWEDLTGEPGAPQPQGVGSESPWPTKPLRGTKGTRGTQLLTFALAPAVAFAITRIGLERLRAFASERHVLISLHINETGDDDRAMIADHGQRAIPFLEKVGFWGPDVLAVHCVRMGTEDLEILSRHDVKVSHNPVSNMYLGSGVAPVGEMRRAGLTVALGTDGAASNNSQDMLETMKCASLVSKLRPGLIGQDAAPINAAQVLDMATILGAQAIGQADRLGSLEPGKQADLFVLDPYHARSIPVLDPVASLVFSAGEKGVAMTIVAGRVVLDQGQITTVDEPALLRDCQAAAWEVARRAGTRSGPEAEYYSGRHGAHGGRKAGF
jgi:5-methylthioadenosine/S-adenosylhomocysteine deaminase